MMTKSTERSFTLNDHIGIFDNYFPDALCDKYLKFFEKIKLSEPNIFGRHKRDNLKLATDEHFYLINEHYENDFNLTYIGGDFQKIFWEECYPKYIEKYPILEKFNRHRIFSLKVQETKKGQGYHAWHTEMMGAGYRNRFMVISLYLNTVEKGGETEFLNQSLRISPVKNRLVVWPATYTHVHRGNPPLSGTKYIITGWIEFGD
jgi:hypothetical protein